MKNLGNMMKQAQQMQQRMAEMQQALEGIEVTGAAGGGMVQVTLNGKGAMRRVRIDPKIVDPADVGMLEDLIVGAADDAKPTVEAHVQEEMQKLTGGLQLPPGFKLPI